MSGGDDVFDLYDESLIPGGEEGYNDDDGGSYNNDTSNNNNDNGGNYGNTGYAQEYDAPSNSGQGYDESADGYANADPYSGDATYAEQGVAPHRHSIALLHHETHRVLILTFVSFLERGHARQWTAHTAG
jgi:hypothetical protein